MNSKSDIDHNSEVLQEALEWRARLDDVDVTDAEKLEFHNWLRRDRHHELVFDYADRFWDATDRLRTELPPNELERLRARRQPNSGRHFARRLWIASIAAAVLLGVFGMFVAGKQEVIVPPQQALEFRTERGRVASFNLSDGTALTLGAASSVEVLLTDTERRVSLKTGDAYFDVASEASRPFLVTIDSLRVSVTGTAFDIRRSGDVTEIGVVEGVVTVSARPQDGSARPATPSNEVSARLTAGNRIAFSNTHGLGPVVATRPDRIGAWRRDRLVFEDAPISEIVADLNRYLARPLLIEDEDVAAMTFSATVGTNDLESFLATLTEVFPVDLHDRSDGFRVLRPAPQ